MRLKSKTGNGNGQPMKPIEPIEPIESPRSGNHGSAGFQASTSRSLTISYGLRWEMQKQADMITPVASGATRAARRGLRANVAKGRLEPV